MALVKMDVANKCCWGSRGTETSRVASGCGAVPYCDGLVVPQYVQQDCHTPSSFAPGFIFKRIANTGPSGRALAEPV